VSSVNHQVQRCLECRELIINPIKITKIVIKCHIRI
jgi:hypothetical protein